MVLLLTHTNLYIASCLTYSFSTHQVSWTRLEWKRTKKNIRAIVETLRRWHSVSAFLLIVNERAARFDSGMQDAVKLIVDSFGSQSLARMGIFFTMASGFVNPQESQAKAAGIASLISSRTQIPLSRLPSWQGDCHPEVLARLGVPQDRITQVGDSTRTAINDMIQWAKTNPILDTTEAVIGEYEQRRLLREAEAKRLEAANKIVHTETERQEVETGRRERRDVNRKTANYWLGTRDSVWSHEFAEYRIDQRVNSVRGDGGIVHSDWNIGGGGTIWKDVGNEQMRHE